MGCNRPFHGWLEDPQDCQKKKNEYSKKYIVYWCIFGKMYLIKNVLGNMKGILITQILKFHLLDHQPPKMSTNYQLANIYF